MDEYQPVVDGNLRKTSSYRVLSAIAPWDRAVEISYDHHLRHPSVDEGSIGPLPQRQAVHFDIVLLPSKSSAAPGG